MEVVLGVSMTPNAVRMVLVEGRRADGTTVDHETIDIGPDELTEGTSSADRVVDAILGTRESAEVGGHRVVCTGVVWSDHAAAAALRSALRARGLAEVVLVSELHAAGALAQAIGATIGCQSTALMFVDGDTATLAVVRTPDGAVVLVNSRSIPMTGKDDFLRAMVGRLDLLDDAPGALFIAGMGPDAAELRSLVAEHTTLPVHAPADADLALARGAALAASTTPRYEAATVGLAPDDNTEAAVGHTQRADAAYMAPLAYSSAPDDPEPDPDLDAYGDGLDHAAEPDVDEPDAADSERAPFLLTGSALATLFVVGMASLLISLVVTISPAAEQRPDTGVVTNSQAPAPEAAPAPGYGSAAPETIQAPIPVVREAPRTVYVAPAAPAPAAPVAVAPPIASAPAAAPPAPAAPAPEAPAPVPVPEAPAAPPRVVPVPVPIVVPVAPPLFPQLPAGPFRRQQQAQTPAPAVTQAPAATQAPVVTQAPAATQAPSAPAQTQAPVVTQAPAPTAAPAESGSGESSSGPTQSGIGNSKAPLWPLWPFGH